MNDHTLSERVLAQFSWGEFHENSFRPGEKTLFPWNSEEGRKRLFSSTHHESFFRLVNFFQPQISPIYCGVASSVIVLNALNHPRGKAITQKDLCVNIPESEQTILYSTFSQSTFLNNDTDKIKPKAVVEYRAKNSEGQYRPGLSLVELAKLLSHYGANAKSQFATEIEESSFRNLLKNGLTQTDRFVLIHFRSDLIGGIPRGHISPLAAYHEETDSVLVLDVAAHKGPWYWAPLSDLLKAMQKTYDTQPQGGGFIEVF